MTKRFIDYIVADYELQAQQQDDLSPRVNKTNICSAQLEVHTHVKRTLCKRSLFEM